MRAVRMTSGKLRYERAKKEWDSYSTEKIRAIKSRRKANKIARVNRKKNRAG